MDIKKLHRESLRLRSIGLTREEQADYIEAFNLLVNEGLELLQAMVEIGEMENQLRVTEETLKALYADGYFLSNGHLLLRSTAVVMEADLSLRKKQLQEWCEELATNDNDG